ncbi:hypothetical protein [Vibrio agarivorans]|uniref:Uncharacterized protein n=1 Tax=Vibrio agarivorans TaxID=153622 RepID=A0ABT7Y645_9VIBR|nr:hypothetical protein [Vibrio agarivorans]MDN2483517.1 hypothetical protein [Vibrio agarivorans]
MKKPYSFDPKNLQSTTSNNHIIEEIFLHAINEVQGDLYSSNFDTLLIQLQKNSNRFILRSELVDALIELENIDVVRFGQNVFGMPVKIGWNDLGLRATAHIALGIEPKTIDLNSYNGITETHLHRFHLRCDLEFLIELPTDLTHDEAERIFQLCQGLSAPHHHHGTNLAVYVFPLREGHDFELTLPRDITETEIHRLKSFLESLPKTSFYEDEFL